MGVAALRRLLGNGHVTVTSRLVSYPLLQKRHNL
jgi:hypothetical protein